MTDLLDNGLPADKAQEAESVFQFITRYIEIHRKPPTLRQCSEMTMLTEYRVRRAVARLHR